MERKFSEQKELIKFAASFVEDKINALKKDVEHCLLEPYAPFPAILFCFSTIDLLGALFGGDASRNARTTDQTKNYMKQFMHYTEDQTNLLMSLFRHKIVHLAQPKSVIKFGKNKNVGWRYWHNESDHHLELRKLPKEVTIQITSCWQEMANYEFGISIKHFVHDIENSVFNPAGYLHQLKQNPHLQDCFEKAVGEIYSINS